MQDSIDELKRQRELIRRHLEWLDAEISRRNRFPDTTPAAAGGLASDNSSPVADSPVFETRQTGQEAEALLHSYQSEASTSPAQAKRGCMLLFGVLMALVVAIGAAIWLLYPVN